MAKRSEISGTDHPPLILDLNDPATENAVADAIVRFKGGGYVPLSQRYPWRFSSNS